ncbi:MAG: DUF6691 family protein [Chthoniobacterales bacterium]
MKENLVGAGIGGTLFGAGLALSGMTDPLRVVAFLDVTGDWDPTLAFVMGAAMVVFAIGYWGLRGSMHLPKLEREPISKRLVLGAIVFGIGWGLGGFCPGPALADLGRLSSEALIFVATMAVGMIIAQRGFGADR